MHMTAYSSGGAAKLDFLQATLMFTTYVLSYYVCAVTRQLRVSSAVQHPVSAVRTQKPRALVSICRDDTMLIRCTFAWKLMSNVRMQKTPIPSPSVRGRLISIRCVHAS